MNEEIQTIAYRSPVEVFEDLCMNLDILKGWLAHLPAETKFDLDVKCIEIQEAIRRQPEGIESTRSFRRRR